MAKLFATKPLTLLMAEAQETGEHCLRRSLGPVNLVTLGIGAIIGAGLFSLTGLAAAQNAGGNLAGISPTAGGVTNHVLNRKAETIDIMAGVDRNGFQVFEQARTLEPGSSGR